jgi:hypothetical protein
MDRADRIERQAQRKAIYPEDCWGFLVKPVTIGKLAMIEPPCDVCIFTLIPLKGNIEKGYTERYYQDCDGNE